MKYLVVLGRQPEISVAELEAQFPDIKFLTSNIYSQSLAYIEFTTESEILIDKLGGLNDALSALHKMIDKQRERKKEEGKS